MKKYFNNGKKQVSVEFEDGTCQFLRRGQHIISDKPVKKVHPDVTVSDVLKNKRVVKNKE